MTWGIFWGKARTEARAPPPSKTAPTPTTQLVKHAAFLNSLLLRTLVEFLSEAYFIINCPCLTFFSLLPKITQIAVDKNRHRQHCGSALTTMRTKNRAVSKAKKSHRHTTARHASSRFSQRSSDYGVIALFLACSRPVTVTPLCTNTCPSSYLFTSPGLWRSQPCASLTCCNPAYCVELRAAIITL